MKRLTIELLPDSSENTGYYLPGDTFGGHVHLYTTSTIKYTCIKIRFVGQIVTKIGKAEEGIYVQNQQVVLIGSANNAAEYQLEEGKYSWPFEFTFPLQHLPSSGKYRHGSVKYTLIASMTATGFLGGMQEHKTTHQVQLKDLINIQAEPYSDSVMAESSIHTKAQSNSRKDLASVKAYLTRSAYLRGQSIPVVIDIAHPRKIRRNPGCWIQLVRKEHYYAGDHAKEYTDILANTSQGFSIDPTTKTCRVSAELTIPLNALPTMTTTKAILIEYYLNIILDLRDSTGFMERSFNRKLKTAQKEKLLGSPGGAELQVPITIGTLSDLLHTHKPSPFTQITDAPSESVRSRISTPSTSPATSPSSVATALPKPGVNNSNGPHDVYPSQNPSGSACSSSEHPSHNQALTQQQIMATFSRPQGSSSSAVNSDSHSGDPPGYTQSLPRAKPSTLNALPAAMAAHSNAPARDIENRNRRHSSSLQLNGQYSSHLQPQPRPAATPLPYGTNYSRSQSYLPQGSSYYQQSGLEGMTVKPLPSLPPQLPQLLPPSPSSLSGGSRPQVGYPNTVPFIPPPVAGPSTVTFPRTHNQYLGARAPQMSTIPPPLPPPLPPQLAWSPNGYPREKNETPRIQPIPFPMNVTTEEPTAPRAVDVGLGPSSPQMHNMFVPMVVMPVEYHGPGIHHPVQRNPSTTEYGSDYRP